MFQQEGKTYDCPYCHNDEKVEGWCQRGVLQGEGPLLISVPLEDATVVADWGQPIQPGDIYLAWSRGGEQWKLLTCKLVNPRHWIMPVENAYSYDTWRCAKVVSIQ